MAKLQQYGKLYLRQFDILGNLIDAFYDTEKNLICVVDKFTDENKPNVALIINRYDDRKWDEILSIDYDLDLEVVRPKQNNKYQKLDIEYSGLDIYAKLLNDFDNGTDITEQLNAVKKLRNSFVRKSALARLDMAKETIQKSQETVLQTTETIAKLQERVAVLKEHLREQKKEIGKIPTKQSAAKILRSESQIDFVNDKLKRANKRLSNAQNRLETANTEIENIHELLNRLGGDYIETDITTAKEIKPLFNTEPNIINNENAFKPINFDAPDTPDNEDEILKQLNNLIHDDESDSQNKTDEKVFSGNDDFTDYDFDEEYDTDTETQENTDDKTISSEPLHFVAPKLNLTPIVDESPKTYNTNNTNVNIEPVAPKTPILESLSANDSDTVDNVDYVPTTPSIDNVIKPLPPTQVIPESTPETFTEQPDSEENTEIIKEEPMSENIMTTHVQENISTPHKPTAVYYVLLVILVMLSIFTLWLYQKNIKHSSPLLVANPKMEVVSTDTPTTNVESVATVSDDIVTTDEDIFMDEIEETTTTDTNETSVESEPVVEPQPETITPEITEPTTEQPKEIIPEPVIEPVAETTDSTADNAPEIVDTADTEIIDKPEYDVGSKDDSVFIDESENADTDVFYDEPETDETVSDLSVTEEYYEE